jgi:hypothetical protein
LTAKQAGSFFLVVARVCQMLPFPSSVTSEFDSDIPSSSSGAPDFSSEIPDSIIFTKKAHQEHKIPTIVKALQKSIIGRKDKTRALVQELQSWQNDNYIDPHYNAQVMFDELQKILPLPFGYEVFKKHYNNTRY